MIDLCVEYGNVFFFITFNPLKSECMAFYPTKNSFFSTYKLSLNGRSLDWVNKIRS